MKTLLLFSAVALQLAPVALEAQSAANPPDLTGVWAPFRAARNTDPKFAAPAATPLVLKPEYAKPWQEKRARDAEANKRGEQFASGAVQCVPYGMPTMMSIALYPDEFIQTPKQITIVTEAFSEVRRVYMNVPQEKIEDVAPGFYGRSVGHWDGDTLVIDTVGIKPNIPGYQGMPHSNQMHITERIKMPAPDYLHDQITINDPVVLEKPVTYTLAFKRQPGYEMVEFVCENNREYVDEKGVVRLQVHDK